MSAVKGGLMTIAEMASILAIVNFADMQMKLGNDTGGKIEEHIGTMSSRVICELMQTE